MNLRDMQFIFFYQGLLPIRVRSYTDSTLQKINEGIGKVDRGQGHLEQDKEQLMIKLRAVKVKMEVVISVPIN